MPNPRKFGDEIRRSLPRKFSKLTRFDLSPGGILRYLAEQALRDAIKQGLLDLPTTKKWDDSSMAGWAVFLDCNGGGPGVFVGSANGDTPDRIANKFVTFCCPPAASWATPSADSSWQWSGPVLSGAYQYASYWHFHDLDIFARPRYDQGIVYRKLNTAYQAAVDKRVPGWQYYPLIQPNTPTGPQVVPGAAPEITPWPDTWPEAQPVEAPQPRPRHTPRRLLPHRRSDPFRHPDEQPQRGNGRPRPRPRPAPDPSPGTGGGTPDPDVNPPRRPPGRGDGDGPVKRGDEKKFGGSGSGAAARIGAAIKRLGEAGLEANDAINAFYWSLSPNARSKKERTPFQRLAQVLSHPFSLDWNGHRYRKKDGSIGWSPGVAQRLATNLFTDAAFGMTAQAFQKAAQAIFRETGYRINSPVGRTMGTARVAQRYF